MKKSISMVLAGAMALSMMGGAALADEEYVYGTANLTWEQFWASEGLTYSAIISHSVFEPAREIITSLMA